VFSGQIVPVQFVPTPGTAARDSNSSRDLGLGGDVVALSGAFRFLETAFRGEIPPRRKRNSFCPPETDEAKSVLELPVGRNRLVCFGSNFGEFLNHPIGT
jgi:hypothetical protein